MKFIQDWLQDRYFRGGYSKGVPDELIQELKLPEYEPCKRVKIIKRGLGNFPFRIYNGYTNKKISSWWIEVRSTNKRSYWYNNDKDYWLFPDENDVWTSSCCHSKLSVKAIIRKILKVWKLPKNCIITIQGRFVIGLNGFTVSSGVLDAGLNGSNIIAKPLAVDKTMRIGIVKKKNMMFNNY